MEIFVIYTLSAPTAMVLAKRLPSWTDLTGVKFVLPMWTPSKRRSEPESSETMVYEEEEAKTSMSMQEIVNQEQLWESIRIDELLEAAKEGNVAKVRHLCEVVEMDPDARGYMGWTAAHWAAREGHLEVLEYLSAIGANLDTLDRKGDCLLHKAAANGQHKVCAWLLQHNFNVQAVNNNGMTPIDLVREKAKMSRDASTALCEAMLVKECDCTF